MNVRWLRTACALTIAGLSGAPGAESVELSAHFPAAHDVQVAGSFEPHWQQRHPMQKNAAGRWTLALDLPPGRYEIQFLVDGQWHHDPSLPAVTDTFGGWNNLLVVPFRDER